MRSIVLVDSNMPRLEDCSPDCREDESILCLHRFSCKTEVEYCNNSHFSGVPDSDIVLYFFNVILAHSEKFIFDPEEECAFFIVTHDSDFIKDVKNEWIKRKQALNPHIRMDFFQNHISVKFWTFSFDLIVENIKAQRGGKSRVRDRELIIKRVNAHLVR